MSKLRSVTAPRGSRSPPAKAVIQFSRQLGWLEVIWGHHELNAYWARCFVPHRWRRYEHKHHSLVAGPLTVLVRDSDDEADENEGKANEDCEHPHLVPIDGGKR